MTTKKGAKSAAAPKKKKVQDCASALASLGDLSDQCAATAIDLSGQYPPIQVMDSILKDCTSCEKLSLSTNNIDRIQNLSDTMPLKILSVGRNGIRKLDGIQPVAGTLEQLWISYNAIERLEGIECLQKLNVLYMSNNKISDWQEIDRLSCLPHLSDVLFIGNPLYKRYQKKNNLAEYTQEMMKRLPHLKKLDGTILQATLTDEEDEEENNGDDTTNQGREGLENE